METKSKKIVYIADIKTVCILLVFFWHCTLFYEDNVYFAESTGIISPAATFIGNIFNVTLIASFVFCAGFLYTRSLERHNRTMPQSIWERVRRLLFSYYLIGTVWLVPLYTFFDIKAFGRPDNAGYIEGYKCMLLGQFSDHLWFLWMLFWVALFFILLTPLIKRNLMIPLFLITMASALIIDLYLYDFPYFKFSQIAPYLLCYFAGICCYKVREKLEALSVAVKLTIAGILFAGIIAYAVIVPQHFAWFYIARPAGAFFTFFLFMVVSDTKFWKKVSCLRVYSFMRESQLNVYLIHMPLPYLFSRLFRPYIGNIPWLCILCCYILVVLTGILIVKIHDHVVSGTSRLINSGGVDNEK